MLGLYKTAEAKMTTYNHQTPDFSCDVMYRFLDMHARMMRGRWCLRNLLY